MVSAYLVNYMPLDEIYNYSFYKGKKIIVDLQQMYNIENYYNYSSFIYIYYACVFQSTLQPGQIIHFTQ